MQLPTWKDITVEKYQLLIELSGQQADEIDKLVQIISVLLDKTEREIGEFSLSTFNHLTTQATDLFKHEVPGQAKKCIKANGKRYYLNYNVNRHRFAQYIEVQHFLKGGLAKNIHLVMASIAQPVRFGIKRKNNSADHERIANDLLKANFAELYHSAVFFCQVFSDFNNQYSGLFEIEEQEESEEDQVAPDFNESNGFHEQYGWIYSAAQVAAHERIPLDEAFELPVIQAFNDLAYLKAFKKNEELLNKQYAKRDQSI